MDATRQSEYLDFFSRVARVAQKRFVDPLWVRYPEANASVWDSLGVFLEGYAFERQGRPQDFPAIAADVIAELRSNTLAPSEVWLRFCTKLGRGRGLNIMNNPLAPKGTPYTKKKGQTAKTSQYSAIELANEVGIPLVQWVLCALKENRTDEVHARIREITGVDQKIASLFLRDVACRYRVFPSTSRELLQPIDIWVTRSAALLGATVNNEAGFIVDLARSGSHEPESINQGMWYFGAEIAGCEYRLKQALANLDNAEALLKRHIDSLSGAARAESNGCAAVQWAERIMKKIDNVYTAK